MFKRSTDSTHRKHARKTANTISHLIMDHFQWCTSGTRHARQDAFLLLS